MEEVPKNQKNREPHPMEKSFFSRLFFCWFPPFLIRGFNDNMNEDNLYATKKTLTSAYLGGNLEKAWDKELEKAKPSLLRAIFNVFMYELIATGILRIFLDIIKITQPILIATLVSYFQTNEMDANLDKIYICASCLIAISLVQVLAIHHNMLLVLTLGMKIRVATCSLIYRKALKLNRTAFADTTIGHMVNLLSNDVARFDVCCQFIHLLWLAPCEVGIVMGFLYWYVGWTGLIGCVFLLGFIPFQPYMATRASQYRLKTAICTDERVRLMSDIISGIQVIKMYAWEEPFEILVDSIRREEVFYIRHISKIRTVMLSFSTVLSRLAVFLCVFTFVIRGDAIVTAYYVFTVISFYSFLRNSVILLFPQAVIQVAEARISISRIQKFLLCDELDIENKQTNINSSLSDIISLKSESDLHGGLEVRIFIKNAAVKWIVTSPDHLLNDVNFEASSNQLVALIGPVGGGKSTLLYVILKEVVPFRGEVEVNGSVSYASQEPWVFGGSIKQNILFGQRFEVEKYRRVIKACALETDFAMLPHGDRTVVGERGATLSGGQKARINLARAVYKDADIYLLDDPLSSVDVFVAKQLFYNCIRGYLKDKCVVLVTHQVHYLHSASSIYLLEDGTIRSPSTYDILKSNNETFMDLLAAAKDEGYKREDLRSRSRILAIEYQPDHISSATEISKEERATGGISKTVYKTYLRAGGIWTTTLAVFLAFVAAQFFSSSTDVFLTSWVNAEQAQNKSVFYHQYGLAIYTVLIVMLVVFAVIRAVSFFKYALKASVRLHDRMSKKVLYSPLSFFNANPSGRILNRFSKDVGALDETLPLCMVDTIGIGLTVLGITIVIGLVNPWVMIPTIAIFVIMYYIKKAFLKSSRNIKRVEAVKRAVEELSNDNSDREDEQEEPISKKMRPSPLPCADKRYDGFNHWPVMGDLQNPLCCRLESCKTRSPMYTHLTASMQGITTIRAFGAEEILCKEFNTLQDNYTSASFMFLAASRGFGFWLDMHCILYFSLVIISLLFIQKESFGGNVGLSLTQALTLAGMFQWGIRQWSELENQMTSVERVQEYTVLPVETDDNHIAPPKKWPQRGRMIFKNVFLRYSEKSSYILNNLNFEIAAGQKVGIVGRTGSGKSSIIQALFRLMDFEGSIFIDGLDTKIVKLKSLRSKMSIIPQEPVLFSGTLRKNLDPFDEFKDEILWNVLELVELKNAVDELKSGLESTMMEGGSNFSLGQRQLLCLARAIIRNNKILVLDEATASVDPSTDDIIQNTIRERFHDCTVLTIAHRLPSVMDSDKILVMDGGRVIEYDHPYLLMLNKNGKFHKLVRETGSTMAADLFSIAKEKYFNNTQTSSFKND